MASTKQGLFAGSAFNSRIQSANVQRSERWLGYFAGPGLVWVAYFIIAGTYLNVFYTDVLKLGGLASGLFLAVLPIASKVFDALTNLAMGQIIERTKSRQGKARPWMLISAPLVGISGIMLYVIPKLSMTGQAIWVAVSYNLFFALAFTVYNMSHQLMVPLSTRHVKQRDGLALFANIGVNMLPGMLVYMVFPLAALPWMGVDQSRWALIMSIFSALAVPGILIQYYFTKERITEDANEAEGEFKTASFAQQMKACFTDKYWIIFFLMMILYQLQQNFYGVSIIYYANWVLGSYNDGSTLTIINAVGQAPLGLGVFLLWPIVKKLGKRKTMLGGMILAAVASIPILFNAGSMGVVLGGLALKSFGMLPTYLLSAMMAEAMDHIEWKNGFRCDGLTATFFSVILTIMSGFSVGLFNLGLAQTGYLPPAADGSLVQQSAATQNYFVLGFAGLPIVCFALIAVLMIFFKVEDKMPTIQTDITARHKAEAEARGEVYLSHEEKVAIEQAKAERIAEEKRVEELKKKCARKGLSFEAEEQKYQEKLAEQAAKEKAKRAGKKR